MVGVASKGIVSKFGKMVAVNEKGGCGQNVGKIIRGSSKVEGGHQK